MNTTSKKINTRFLRSFKSGQQHRPLQMLTCYDFQTAQMLDQTSLDLILVGDSLGNVVLGYPTTIQVSLPEMLIFAAAVKRGAPHKFVIADLPFGTYASFSSGIKNACELFQKSGVEALKMEGAFPLQLKLIKRLTETGIPVMGHIGLTPQSVHQQGGYFTHGKTPNGAQELLLEARLLQEAGVFAIVLECVEENVSAQITQELHIPTIGIGSGAFVDGQVLVLNDLLQMGPERPPKFCTPIANFFALKKKLIQEYLQSPGPQVEMTAGNERASQDHLHY